MGKKLNTFREVNNINTQEFKKANKPIIRERKMSVNFHL